MVKQFIVALVFFMKIDIFKVWIVHEFLGIKHTTLF